MISRSALGGGVCTDIISSLHTLQPLLLTMTKPPLPPIINFIATANEHAHWCVMVLALVTCTLVIPKAKAPATPTCQHTTRASMLSPTYVLSPLTKGLIVPSNLSQPHKIQRAGGTVPC
jgi:hypothetical protein